LAVWPDRVRGHAYVRQAGADAVGLDRERWWLRIWQVAVGVKSAA